MNHYYQNHTFFCTHLRTNAKPSCGKQGGEWAKVYLKKRLQAEGLWGKGASRVSTSGCLGRCEMGPCLVIYPEGVWYTYQTEADLDEIVEQHFKKGELVDRLIIPFRDGL